MEWHSCSHRSSRALILRVENVSPNNLAALPEKDGCKNRFYVHMRRAFFQREEESFWQPLNGNPHFRQGIMAMLCLQSLPFKLKKWQLYTAMLSSNYGKAHSTYEQQLEPKHPWAATSVWWLAVLSERQQQREKAASFYQRALSIDEHALGPQHPTTQAIRASYARLLRTMGHDAEAAALEQP